MAGTSTNAADILSGNTPGDRKLAITDYLSQVLGSGATPDPGNATAWQEWNAINSWLLQLPDAMRQQALAFIPGGFADPGGGGGGNLSDLANNLKTKFGGDPLKGVPPSAAASTTPAPAGQATQQQQSTAAQAVVGNLSEQAQPGVGVPGSGQQPYKLGGTATGGFNEQLQAYYDYNFNAAGTDVNALAQMAGTDPTTLAQQYQSYLKGLNAAYANRIATTDQPAHINSLSINQFAEQKAQSFTGPFAAVMDAVGRIWQSQYQQALPPALQAQILSALNAMPPDQKQNVLYNAMLYMENAASAKANNALFDQSGNYATSVLQALPSSILTYSPGSGVSTGSLGTGGIVGTYAQVHPSGFLQQEKNQQAIASQFQATLGRAPTSGDLAALGPDPTDAQITTYINNQPLPNDPKVRYGEYAAVQKFVDPLYNTYFGGPASPSQLMSYMGMNQQQITDHIMASPSTQLPGETVGRYVQLKGFADSLVSKIGYGVSDQVIAAAHKGMVSGG